MIKTHNFATLTRIVMYLLRGSMPSQAAAFQGLPLHRLPGSAAAPLPASSACLPLREPTPTPFTTANPLPHQPRRSAAATATVLMGHVGVQGSYRGS
jgi:hypothetical protein